MPRGGVKVTSVLSRDEIRSLNRKSDLAGWWSLIVNYTIIAGCLALVAWQPNVLTVLVAMVLLGGRQLGLSVLMHDAAHQSLFASRGVNLFVGRWLCAAPVFSSLDSYFKKHARHHIAAGSEEDPDLENYRHYAVPRASFRRKVLRDLTGQTGVKTLYLGLRYEGLRRFVRPLIVNAMLAALLAALGHPWLYLLWIGSFLTTNMLFARLRQAAEHAVVPDLAHPDPRMHTRTTLANWLERLTLAPNRVNYHLEHHLLPSVPPHNLARMHRMLWQRGFYEGADIAHGYLEVVRKLTRSQPVAAATPESA
jgi:fatty acid desaturase